MSRHTRCARCDFEATDQIPLALHSLEAEHPLCSMCLRSLDPGETRICTAERFTKTGDRIPSCLDNTRHLLRTIGELFADLEFHVGHINGSLHTQNGYESDGLPLPGGDRLVLLSGGSQGLSDDGMTVKPTDPPSVSFDLQFWALGVMDARQDHADNEAVLLGGTPTRVVRNSLRYLDRTMLWSANQFPGFDLMVENLRELASRLERATGQGLPVEKANADCFDCGGKLIRRADPRTGLIENRPAECKDCGAVYDPQRYHLALREAWERDVEVWVPLTEAARLVRRSVETVETWAKRGQVESACRCSDGRKLVRWPDVQARDREARERAARAAVEKAKRDARLREAS